MKRISKLAAAGVGVALVGLALPVVARELARLVPVEEKGHDDQRDLDWEVSYYQLDGLADADVQKEVNGSLRRMTLAAKRLMLIHLKDWEKPENWDMSNSLGVSMGVGLHTAELLSVSQSIDNYFAGAAHPNLTLRARSFDLTTGRRLFLKDIFRAGAVPEVAKRVDQKLRTMDDFKMDGEYFLDPVEAENIQEAMLTSSGVTLLFSPYEVGPYAAGPVTVELSYAELNGLLSTEGAVGRHVAQAASGGAHSAGINRALGGEQE